MVGRGFLAVKIGEFLWVSGYGDQCVLVGF